jgi:pimeloyl-ACP methyl ester carboxylesterase
MRIEPQGYDGCARKIRDEMDANAAAIYRELSDGTGELFLAKDDAASIQCPVAVLVGKQTAPALFGNAGRVAACFRADVKGNKKLIEVDGVSHLMPVQAIGSAAIATIVKEMAES